MSTLEQGEPGIGARRRVRYGMVGGGPGAFIGKVHRMAAALDGEFVLAAGAFSASAEQSSITGGELGLAADRVYSSFEEMAGEEAQRSDGDRIEVVSIVTPNHLHFSVAKLFLEAGIDVICDKPLSTTTIDANELIRLTQRSDRLFAVTYNYTGYPMIKEARERIAAGSLGTVRKVVVEYAQGWLSTSLEGEGHKQAEWRTDPDRAGSSSALGDIGSHASNLVEYVTDLTVQELFADLGTVVDGRRLDDDAAVLLRFETGARGVLLASQISTGERNRLRLSVYGTEGGLKWCHEEPNLLRLSSADGTETVLHRGTDGLSERASAHTRLPSGHPEGFIEGFANIYRNVARTIRSRNDGADSVAFMDDFPSVADGARGVRFIEAAVASSREGRWIGGGRS